MPGAEAAVCLLPESGTAAVVLQNSLGLCTAADWACQAIVNTIISGQPGHDYLELARESVRNGGRRMEEVRKQLDDEQILGTKPRPLADYVGKYRNAIGHWIIEICIDRAGKLCLKFQAREDELYVLRHYQHDVFVWNLSYDEMVKRSQFLRPYPYYKIEFESGASDHNLTGQPIDRLRWRHDPNVPEGEIFTKVARGSTLIVFEFEVRVSIVETCLTWISFNVMSAIACNELQTIQSACMYERLIRKYGRAYLAYL